jgi:hypothetical protein
MSKHVIEPGKKPNRSFKAASLKLDPSLIAIACHLARIAAENDYKNLPPSDAIPYNAPDTKGGPQ